MSLNLKDLETPTGHLRKEDGKHPARFYLRFEASIEELESSESSPASSAIKGGRRRPS